MNIHERIVTASALAWCAPASVLAQESAPGNVVAEQLAASSLRMIGSMVAVLALVAICAWALRRWRDHHGSDNGSIEIVSGLSLGSKERIVLLRVGDEQVLVGVSPAGMRRLHVVTQLAESSAVAQVEQKDVLVTQREDSEAPRRPAESLPGKFSLSLGAAQ